MPEAAVDEYGDPSRSKDEVRPPPPTRNHRLVDTVAKPSRVQKAANGHFCGCVTLAHSLHTSHCLGGGGDWHAEPGHLIFTGLDVTLCLVMIHTSMVN